MGKSGGRHPRLQWLGSLLFGFAAWLAAAFTVVGQAHELVTAPAEILTNPTASAIASNTNLLELSVVATNKPASVITNTLPAASVATNALEVANTLAAPARSVATNGSVAVQPTDPALASFKVKPGFRIELAAAPGLVVAPAAMAFDQNGRLFVAEMRDYPDQRNASPHLGKIRLLEDSTSEGVYNTSTVYADDLALPSAVACYAGGVIVASTPDILFLKDSSGNGVADVRRVLFTGFGGSNTVAAEALVNSFTWGLDNRIHGVAAGQGGTVRVVEGVNAAVVALVDSDFSFDPRTLAFFAETGSAQSGLAFDTWGRKFLTDYRRPLYRPLYRQGYLARNPFFAPAPALVDVLKPATEIYSASAGQPPVPLLETVRAGRSILRTNAPVWMTQARGTVIYRGGLFPSNYLHNAFIADPQAHLVHRAILRDTGTQVLAEREEADSEFLVSSDPLFRPSQVIEGPEGALYIADMRDAQSGGIYRIVPEGFARPKPPRLGRLGTLELVATLASANAWERDTGARLLAERLPPEAVPLLGSMLANSRLAYARVQALHTLNALGALTDEHLLRAMRDIDGRVREQGVLLATRNALNGVVSSAIWSQLLLLSADGYFPVRYQLAFTAGDIRHDGRAALLAELLRRDFANPWMQTAVLSSASDSAGGLFVVLASDTRFRSDPAGAGFLQLLAGMIGCRGKSSEIAPVLRYILENQFDLNGSFIVLSSLGEGLHRAGRSLSLADAQGSLAKLYERAYLMALDKTVPESVRASGIRLLGYSTYTQAQLGDLLLALIGPGESIGIQSAALATLAEYPGAGGTFIDRWPVLLPALRGQALNSLFSRVDRLPAVILGLERGVLRPVDLLPVQANLLRTWPAPGIREPALQLLGPVPAQRPPVVQAYGAALGLSGSPARGRDIFIARCTACHQVGGVGSKFGPDLAGIKLNGRGYILDSILQPSSKVRPGFQTSIVLTRTEDLMTGIVRDQLGQAIVVNLPGGGRVVWPAASIQAVRTEPWSMMPEGLETGLSAQGMADLLDFLMTAP